MAEMPPENPNRPREYHGGRTLVAGVGVVVVIALVLWLALLRGGDEVTAEGIVELPAALNPDGRHVGPRILAMAPDFELETLDGERLRLSDLRGRPVVNQLLGLVVLTVSARGPRADSRAARERRLRPRGDRRQHRGAAQRGAGVR